ncbi:O-antigen ligase family protein [Leifsonia sp. NPDC080035]|uniref:O-antigen ligase family protein n=1 Tax=Leifsonia sp. NPDC080035 TaxID=3143936 RepID=A0AAU7GGJ1_9MICO
MTDVRSAALARNAERAAPVAPRTDGGRGTLYVVWLLLLASIVPWRRDVYFEGGLDPVVVAKAVIGVAALLVAASVASRRPRSHRIGLVSVGFLVLFASVAMIGSLASGNGLAAGISTIRLGIVAATIAFVVVSTDAERVLRTLLTSMACVGLLATVSGLGSLASGSRLSGTFPPLNPNDIALLCAAPAIGLMHELFIGDARWRRALPLFALLAGIVFVTQSRTGLLAMLAGCLVVLLHARRLAPRAMVGLLVMAPLSLVAVTTTGIVDSLVQRGDPTGQNLLTLSARTIAWSAVLSTPDNTWARWVGSGMAVRQVQVAGQYWDNQVLDSSWISALAQAGVIGVVIMAAWALCALVWSVQTRGLRSITTPLLVFVFIRSFLENGLVDTNVMFVLFFTVVLLLEGRRLDLRGAPPASSPNSGASALSSHDLPEFR